MSEIEERKERQKQRLSGWWIVLAIVVAIIGIPAIAYGIFSLTSSRAMEAELERLRAAGELIDLMDWAPPPIPPDEDSTPIFQEAFVAHDIAEAALKASATNEASEDSDIPSLAQWYILLGEEPWEQEHVSIARQVLTGHADTLEALRRIPPRPRVNFEWNYQDSFAMLLDELMQLRGCGRVAALAARLEAMEADYEQMVKDIQTGLRIASVPDEDHMLIVHLVRIAFEAIAVGNLESILREYNVPAELLAQLDADLRNARRELDFGTSMACERAMGLDTLLRLTSGEMDIRELSGMPEGDRGGSGLRVISRLAAPFFRKGVIYYLERMGQLIEAAKRPTWEATKEVAAVSSSLEEEMVPDSPFFRKLTLAPTAILMPGLSRALDSHLDSYARLDSMRIAIALRRYRAEKGELAPGLKDLAPKFLPELPLDPYTGKEFLIKREDGMVTIYSASSDLRDDGGQIESDERPGRPPDLGVRIREEISE